MKLHFIKANPTENMTIFVRDPLPRSMYSEVANKLMDYGNLCGEQVGFIEQPTMPGSFSRLHMMGGEFCGNASRAFAALLVRDHPETFEKEEGVFLVPVEISGNEEVLVAKVRPVSDHVFDVDIKLPLFHSISPINTVYKGKPYQGALVEFEGISHVVLQVGSDNPDEGLLRQLVNECKPRLCSAFGVMFYDESLNFMTPLVYVEDTGSIIWERSCGTGSAALGVALSQRNQCGIDATVGQPGGRLRIRTVFLNGRIDEIHLQGEVALVCEGEVYI